MKLFKTKTKHLHVHLGYFLIILGILATVTGVFAAKGQVDQLTAYQEAYESQVMTVQHLTLELDSLKALGSN